MVRARGDAAVIALTERFDRLALTPDTPAPDRGAEIDAPLRGRPSDDERAALNLAAQRIRAYHARQMPDDASWTDPRGGHAGLALRAAVSAAGLYVPGGAGVVSVVGADERGAGPRWAGVGRLAMVVPTPDGVVNPAVMLAARIAGVDEGLSHRRRPGPGPVAAPAYGTDTNRPGSDKITGPGNAYVAAAKRRVFRQGRHHMIAGPSRDPGDRRWRQRSGLGSRSTC